MVTVCNVGWGKCLQSVCFSIADAFPLASCVMLSRSFNLRGQFDFELGATWVSRTEPKHQHQGCPRLGQTAVQPGMALTTRGVVCWDYRPFVRQGSHSGLIALASSLPTAASLA